MSLAIQIDEERDMKRKEENFSPLRAAVRLVVGSNFRDSAMLMRPRGSQGRVLASTAGTYYRQVSLGRAPPCQFLHGLVNRLQDQQTPESMCRYGARGLATTACTPFASCNMCKSAHVRLWLWAYSTLGCRFGIESFFLAHGRGEIVVQAYNPFWARSSCAVNNGVLKLRRGQHSSRIHALIVG